jgi:hypothetical protein
MTKKITKVEQLQYDIGYAYGQLDEIFAIAQLLKNYVENEKNESLNKWTVGKGLEGLMTLVMEIQVSLESTLEKNNE